MMDGTETLCSDCGWLCQGRNEHRQRWPNSYKTTRFRNCRIKLIRCTLFIDVRWSRALVRTDGCFRVNIFTSHRYPHLPVSHSLFLGRSEKSKPMIPNEHETHVSYPKLFSVFVWEGAGVLSFSRSAIHNTNHRCRLYHFVPSFHLARPAPAAALCSVISINKG